MPVAAAHFHLVQADALEAAQATSHSSRTSSAAEHEATKAHRLLALGVPATNVRHAREAE